MGTDHHVERSGRWWVVRAAGSPVIASIHATREAAVEAARILCRLAGGALIVVA
jgi:hypothetical protein